MKKKIVLLTIIISIIAADLILHIFLARFNYLNNWHDRNELWTEDSILGWFNRYNADEYVHGTDFHSHVTTDSNGFRKDTRDKGETILLIGDSFVQACEVDDSMTFAYLMESMLDKNIINAGVAGYGTDQEMLLLERIIAKNMDIKHVIFFFYINDLKDIINNNLYSQFPSKPMFIAKGDSLVPYKGIPDLQVNSVNTEEPGHLTYRISKATKNLLYRSAIYRIAVSGLQFTKMGKWLYSKNLMNIPDYMSYDWRLADDEILTYALPVFRMLLKRIKKQCKDNNIRISFILIPSELVYQDKLSAQLKALEKLYGYCNNIEYAYNSITGILDDEDIDYIYPLDEFMKQDREKTLTFAFDKHLSKRGHRVMAGIIKEWLIESGSYR